MLARLSGRVPTSRERASYPAHAIVSSFDVIGDQVLHTDLSQPLVVSRRAKGRVRLTINSVGSRPAESPFGNFG